MIRRPAFSYPQVHKASVWKNANQGPVTAFSDTAITFSTLKEKVGSYVDPSSVSNKLVAKKSGMYVITFTVWTTGGSAGERNFSVLLGSTKVLEVGLQAAGRGSWKTDAINLAVNTEVGVSLYAAVSSVTVAGSASKDTALAMEYIGPA